jgi:2-methylcitrate dehydratase PrpD
MKMGNTVIPQLAEFTEELSFGDLPPDIIDESKRIILDAIGCTLGGTTHEKGLIGVEFARSFRGSPEATVIGYGDRLSCLGAAFANAELMNALDFDPILPPGHVTPYVLPTALAVGESKGKSGKELILVTALAHEISYRIGKAMDYLRDIKEGKVVRIPVFGYSSSIFGSVAGVGKLKGFDKQTLANAMGLAGSICPANTQKAWQMHAPSTTVKYTVAGWLNLGALTAAGMAELGHRGDIRILDDEWGFGRFIGSTRWEPDVIIADLGKKWLFTPFVSYKPYPFCRNMATPLDCLIHLVEENDIKPEEIESIHALTEGFAMEPVWLNRIIERPSDAQFSMAHGLALVAHRIPPGPRWQDMDVVMNPSILKLMDKVTCDVHPDYVKALEENPTARPSKVEIRARGKVFVEERLYPKGSPSPLPETYSTTNELIAKFKTNASRMLLPQKIEAAVDMLLKLEDIKDISDLLKLVSLRNGV